MKLETDFSALDDQMRRMGARETMWRPDESALKPIEQLRRELEKEGIEIEEITEVRAEYGGLLTYKGEQVLLYIKDTGSDRATLILRPEDSKRYHVAECRALDRMRAIGRFDRYLVTTRKDGKFVAEWVDRESGQRGEVEAALKVCKDCLKALNWEGYADRKLRLVGRDGRRKAKADIWSGFNISHFLREHVTFFHSRPSGVGRVGGRYAIDWSIISEQTRRARDWRCEQCHVVLADHPQLLHCHHRNGVKSDNSAANLQVLCVLCHAAAPLHAHMRVTPKEKALIESLRRR